MKMISANKLNRLWKNGVVAKMVAKTRVLKTKEEILANTSVENVAGAATVKELINKVAAQPNWIIDTSTGKITGYKTPGGADTVFPFSGASTALFVGKVTVTGRNGAKKTGSINVVGCTGFTKKSDTQLICNASGSYVIYSTIKKSNDHKNYVGKLSLKVNNTAAVSYSCGGSGKSYAFEQVTLSFAKGDTIEVEASITSNDTETATVTNMVQCCICKPD